MNYKALLAKYISYVLGVEGTDFIGEDGYELDWRGEADIFSVEEKEALQNVAAKMRAKF